MKNFAYKLADEIRRQGGSIRVGLGELLVDLPEHMQTDEWLQLLRTHKALLLDTLKEKRIDREDYEAHLEWSRTQSP